MDDFFSDEATATATGTNGAEQTQKSEEAEEIDAVMVDNPYEATKKEEEKEKETEEDLFAGVTVPSADKSEATQVEKENAEPTFLSVWQENRRKTLEERAKTERGESQRTQEEAKGDLQKFLEERQKRAVGQKEQHKGKEKALREDLNSVFEHGTIWEQVARMVNLQELTDKRGIDRNQERMRSLLIELKNEKKST